MINAELNHYKKIFLKDEVLIIEGETGSEILLLEKGIVDVLIKGKKSTPLTPLFPRILWEKSARYSAHHASRLWWQ